jgi:mono/diheme cytochrome c family protein
LTFIVAALAALVCVALWGWLKPERLPRWAWALPAILVVVLVGQFERTREFIRKPYIIGGYMYANGIRVSDYPMLARDGILRHSEFVSVAAVTPENRLEAGKAVFMVACSRCHTLGGVNNLPDRLRGLYGGSPWDAKAIDRFLATIHGARPFMPPFPGSAQEREALAAYLAGLQTKPDTAEGAQTVGIPARSH